MVYEIPLPVDTRRPASGDAAPMALLTRIHDVILVLSEAYAIQCLSRFILGVHVPEGRAYGSMQSTMAIRWRRYHSFTPNKEHPAAQHHDR